MKVTRLLAAALLGACVVALPVASTPALRAAAVGAPRVVRIGAMSAQRAAHQATLLQAGGVLITGGCGGERCDSIHASVDLYDPATQSFRPIAPMATPRTSHVAIALRDGRVLVSGGWTGQRASAEAELYDPTSGRFMDAGNMIHARISPVAVMLPGGRVLITGGEAAVSAPLASAEMFDPATSTFSAASPMRAPRMSHIAVPLADGRVLIAGGHSVRGEVLRSAEVFDPATGHFQPTGSLTVPRHKHAAVALADGTVLIIGGSDAADYRGRYSSTERYDPATGTFSPGPEMRWMRHKIRDAVIALPSGVVVVAGGAARPELYDVAGRRFTSGTGELSGTQMFATATLLRTGEVLVLGGYDERIQPSASAWHVEIAR